MKSVAVSIKEVESAKEVVTCTFSIKFKPIIVLLDYGASNFYILTSKIEKLGLSHLEITSYVVSEPLDETYFCTSVIRNVPLKILKIEFPSYFYEYDLNINLGMYLLGKYKDVIECHIEKVSLIGPKVKKETYHRLPNRDPKKFNISQTLFVH